MGSVFNTKHVREVQQYLKTLTVDPQEYRKDILLLHNKRTVHKLASRSKMSINQIRRAAAIDQSYRSRILALMLECKYLANMIEPMKEDLLLRLLINYADLIPPSTKTEKKVYLELGFNKRFHVLDDLYVAIETAEYVIEDIDKASWSLKLLLSSFEIGTRPEINI